MKFINTILVAIMVAAANAFADITVSDVEVFSGYPWQEVVVGYAINGTKDVPVSIWLTATDKADNKTYDAMFLSGAETGPGRHVLRWRAVDEGVRFKSDNVVFTVSIRDWIYCVVDLSNGASAESYPVTYMNVIPRGGWTSEYKTTKLVLKRIEAGSFLMGGKVVTLTKPFYIGVFEITQAQWQNVMGVEPGKKVTVGTQYYMYYYNGRWTNDSGHGDVYPCYNVKYSDLRGGVKGVQWPTAQAVDANSFMGVLQTKTGLDFDLPTEAQWEYACRAGTTTTYYWGTEADTNYAWSNDNSYSPGRGCPTHPVGTRKPNGWGLYDMIGNVQEWCLDWYKSDWTPSGEDPKGVISSGYRVVRGGDVETYSWACTSSLRRGYSPGSAFDYCVGFRVVRTLSR